MFFSVRINIQYMISFRLIIIIIHRRLDNNIKFHSVHCSLFNLVPIKMKIVLDNENGGLPLVIKGQCHKI